MINKAFKGIKKLSEQLHDNKISEMSVKRSQILLSFEDSSLITMTDLNILDTLGTGVTDITSFNEFLFVGFKELSESKMLSQEMDSCFKDIYSIIVVLRDNLCTCPALEFIISEEYIKIFIDLPNIQLSAVNKLNDIFKQDPFLELSADRPYLLYINEEVVYE